MKQEELLYKDFSARVPYGVKVKTPYNDAILIGLIKRKGYKKDEYYIDVITDKQTYPIRYIQPYLRPMSSMTEEERNELSHYDNSVQRTDFFYSHHIDCRFMIEKGLALEVTEENNPYKD